MAIQTKVLRTFDGGTVRWELDWDDQSLILRTIRCINNSAFPSRLVATVQATGRTGSLTAPAGQTSVQNLPTGPQTRLDISFDAARDRLTGVDYTTFWPS